MNKKYNEKIITGDGKMMYAVSLDDKKSNSSSATTYIKIQNGQIYFSDRCYNTMIEFDINSDVHELAKETFISQLRTCIREKINDLKILEELFKEINLSECLGLYVSGKDVTEIKQLDSRHLNNVLESEDFINYD